MTRLLIVGGTGTAGGRVVAEALRRGHEVTVASRHVPDAVAGGRQPGALYLPVDLIAATGLDEALDGVDVIVDTTNGVGRSSSQVLTVGALNLLHAAARWGIRRAVLLSIVNVEKSDYHYYRAKSAQEKIYRDCVLETRILRATQFHDFVGMLLAAGRPGFIPVAHGVRFQPIATGDVAVFLVDAAEGHGIDRDRTADFGGPAVLSMKVLARKWKEATGSRRPLVGIPLPGALGRTWRAGENLVPDRALGTVTFDHWLAARP